MTSGGRPALSLNCTYAWCCHKSICGRPSRSCAGVAATKALLGHIVLSIAPASLVLMTGASFQRTCVASLNFVGGVGLLVSSWESRARGGGFLVLDTSLESAAGASGGDE